MSGGMLSLEFIRKLFAGGTGISNIIKRQEKKNARHPLFWSAVHFNIEVGGSQGRPLILGGVEIPHTLGLLGHSDADVLVHAIMDALLGAAALGDIGKHFPDTDPQYKGISSMKLLEHVRLLLEKNGYVVENIDATVIAQKPKLRPYIAQMEENIAKTLGIAKEQINIKATTEEGLGFTGTEEGISSQAICMLNGFYESSMVVGGGSKCAGCPGCSRS